MQKQRKGLYVALGVCAIAFGAWYLYSHTKRFYATTIVKYGGSRGFAMLLTFDEGYLKSWAKSIKVGKEKFAYNGNDYNTIGGLIIK